MGFIDPAPGAESRDERPCISALMGGYRGTGHCHVAVSRHPQAMQMHLSVVPSKNVGIGAYGFWTEDRFAATVPGGRRLVFRQVWGCCVTVIA
jgi:hypothetical protein